MSLIRLGNDRYSPRHRETGLSPFLLECAKQGKTGRFEVLSIDRAQPPAEVAERLGVSSKTKSVLRRENVFYADDDPVEQVTTYIPWTIAKGTGLLQDEVPHQFGIHGILEDQQHVMTGSGRRSARGCPVLRKAAFCGCGRACPCGTCGTPASTRTASRTS